MESKQLKNSLRSVCFGTVNKFITIAFPFLTITAMIKVLGAEYLGLNSLFTSILGALNLAELGFSGVIIYFMYEPIAKNDVVRVCGVLELFRKIYFIVGCIVLTIGVALTPFITLFIKGTYPSNINIYVIYLISLFNTVISYFLFAYKSALLYADQRIDIESNISSVVYFVTYIVQFIVLLTLKNYYVYVIMSPIATIIVNIIRSKIVNRRYPQYFDNKVNVKINKDDEILIWKKASATFGFKINSIIIKSADSMVISAFLGLVSLAKYNNYFYIVSSLIIFWDIVQTSIRPSVGNSIITESVEKNQNNMKKLTFVYSWGIGWCCVCLLCLYQHFIMIWLGSEYMLPLSTVILMIFYFYSLKMIDAINVYKDAHGFWLQDKFRPLVESPFNLVVNIILVNTIGLNGVLISTIMTLVLISYPTIVHVMYKYYFQGSSRKYILLLLKYTIINVLVAGFSYYMCSYIPQIGIGWFVTKIVICIIVPNVLYTLIHFNTPEFKSVISMIKMFIKAKISK